MFVMVAGDWVVLFHRHFVFVTYIYYLSARLITCQLHLIFVAYKLCL